ncbi:MAG: 50S ribosomal protein L10, partial [Propioniciclava sp.]
EVKQLADLESREVLLAKLAGAMQANLSKAVYLFAAPLNQAARALGALEQAAGANPSLIGGAGHPAADADQKPDTAEDASAPEAAPAAEATDAADAAE